MAILNYTTQVDVAKTLAEIQRMLAEAGAKAIAVSFDTEHADPARRQVAVALEFQIRTPMGLALFRLPCDLDAVLAILRRQHAAKKVPGRLVNFEQAARVGWRIIKDWLEAQLALISTQMVGIDQVFLPYAVTRSGDTLYTHIRDHARDILLLEQKR